MEPITVVRDSMTVFSSFRPLYLLFIGVLALLLIISIVQKGRLKVVNGFTVGLFVFISIIVTASLTYQIGILSDELGVGGDPVSFLLFVGVVFLALVSPIVYWASAKRP